MNELKKDYQFWTGFYLSDRSEKYDYFSWASNKAYLDMNRTLTFSEVGDSEKEKKQIAEKREEWRNACTTIIRDNFRKLDDFTSFDCWHKSVCDELISYYKEYDCENKPKLVLRKGNKRTGEKTTLTYGQAQKWLNMTLKYLWLLSRLGLLQEHDKGIVDEYEQTFHVPLDSYILRYAACDPLKDESACCTERKLKEPVPYKELGGCEWSKHSCYCKYREYQTKLRKAITGYDIPLECELEHWHKAVKLYKS